MMLALARIFLGSRVLQLLGVSVVALGGFKVWQKHERSVGARMQNEKIEKKANEDAQKSDDVRSDVVSGKRGVRDPAKRDPSDKP